MLVADLAQALEIAFRRDQHAGGAGDRLDDDRGNGGGVVQRDDAFQILGQVDAMLRLAPGEGVVSRIVGVPEVVDA